MFLFVLFCSVAWTWVHSETSYKHTVWHAETVIEFEMLEMTFES